MDIFSKKYQLIEWIMNLRDTQMIDKLLNIAEKADWWTELSQTERNSIEKGLKDLSESKLHNLSDLKKLYDDQADFILLQCSSRYAANCKHHHSLVPVRLKWRTGSPAGMFDIIKNDLWVLSIIRRRIDLGLTLAPGLNVGKIKTRQQHPAPEERNFS
jgi:hypothetical protein